MVEAAAAQVDIELQDHHRRIETKIHVVQTLNDAFDMISATLNAHLRQRRRGWNSVVVCQTIFDESELCSAVPALGQKVFTHTYIMPLSLAP